MSHERHGSPILAMPPSELGAVSIIEPTIEKSWSIDTGHAEILPSGITEKKSMPDPHRRPDFLPERSESITPMNGTIPTTRWELDISPTHESTSEEMPEL